MAQLLSYEFALKGSKLFIIIFIFCAYTWTISGERLQDNWSSGLSIVLLRFISVIIQVSFGTQAPHILSAVVIRVGVNVAIKTELFYIVLTLKKACSTPIRLIFYIFVSPCPFFVLSVRQCRAS